MNESHLFIGGPKDGQWMAVHAGVMKAWAMDPPTLVASEQTSHTVRYDRVLVGCEHSLYSVFVCERMELNVVALLIAGYARQPTEATL